MRNRFSILRVSKSYFTILITIVFSNPKTLFIHNTNVNIMLTHLFINPKISCTTTLSLKFVINYGISNVTTNLFRITMKLKLTCHLTRTHSITTITITERFTNSRSSHRPILTNSKKVKVNINIRIWVSQLKAIKITTMSTSSKISHNTNLSNTIRSNQTILFNKPMSCKFNIKCSTTLTRSSISCVKPYNIIIELHTTHSLPIPLNLINVNNTSVTLTFSKESKWKSIIVHTIGISQDRINLSRLLCHKISNSSLIRITTVIITTTRYFSKFIHTFIY